MEDTLVLVHTIFRHGDRTPDEQEYTHRIPEEQINFHPFGYGQLTNNGKKRAYRLGKDLRNRYDNFLGETYTPGILDPISSDFDRTKATLQLVLASLFPPKGDLIWEDDMPWQPIPFRYFQRTEDKLFVAFAFDPVAIKIYEEYTKELGKSILENNAGVVQHISDKSGVVIDNTRKVLMLSCTLKAEEEYGLELPSWSKSVWPHPIEEIATYEYDILSAPRLKRFTSGKLLEKIIADTKLKISGKSQCKMHMYSGHEINVAVMLKCLGVYHRHIPPYCANVRLEVHRISGVYGFKIYYQKDPQEEPQLLEISHCGTFCPIESFARLVEDATRDV